MPERSNAVPASLKEGITLGPSPQLAVVVCGLSALVALALYIAGLDPLGLVGAVGLLGFWCWETGTKHVSRSADKAIVAFGWYEGGDLWFLNRQGEHNRCTMASCFIGDWLTLLVLRDEHNRRWSVVLSTDNVSISKRRLVRLYLRTLNI